VNADVLDHIRLGSEETVWYASTGGARVQGWIIKPPGFDKSKKYPLIMEIHGGPHGMYNGAFSYQLQNFAANGNVVLITKSPRQHGLRLELRAMRSSAPIRASIMTT